jgi:hypothetical protein
MGMIKGRGQIIQPAGDINFQGPGNSLKRGDVYHKGGNGSSQQGNGSNNTNSNRNSAMRMLVTQIVAKTTITTWRISGPRNGIGSNQAKKALLMILTVQGKQVYIL